MSATGDAARQYAEAGWSLVPIDGGRKGPTFRGWNLPQRCVTDPDTAAEIDGNVGLAHAYSRTCVIDVDDLATARDWLAERGIDLAELMSAPDAVMISSGRRNRGKLLYRLPDGGEPLMSRRPTGSGLELRCGSGGGLTVQDVLPPSIHPDTGQPYKWIFGEVGHWSCPPVLPDALLQLWQAEATVQEPAAQLSHASGRGRPQAWVRALAFTSPSALGEVGHRPGEGSGARSGALSRAWKGRHALRTRHRIERLASRDRSLPRAIGKYGPGSHRRGARPTQCTRCSRAIYRSSGRLPSSWPSPCRAPQLERRCEAATPSPPSRCHHRRTPARARIAVNRAGPSRDSRCARDPGWTG